MPDAPCPQFPPIFLQHWFSSAVSCATGMAHAIIGPPNRRTTSSSRKLTISFIDDERLQLTDRHTRCLHLFDTFPRRKFQKKMGLGEPHFPSLSIYASRLSR